MKSDPNNNRTRVLALDPTSRGLAYAVFEGEDRLLDWGTCTSDRKHKNESSLLRVGRLLLEWDPSVVVLQDATRKGSYRCLRIQRLLESIRELANDGGKTVCTFPKRTVKAAFAIYDARTKEERAAVVAGCYPELAPRLPPHRKIWMSEDERINIFDAAGLALTYFEIRRRKRGSTARQG